jgi:uncharacterized repeat protein (TIGR03803 family)
LIWNFAGGPGDGTGPAGGVVIGQGGVLYGTTIEGGASGDGTVFALSPPASPGGAWTESILWNFAGGPTDGSTPDAGLVLGADGALYGATYAGGAKNGGAVFSLTPPVNQGGAWTESVLHSFGAHSGGINAPLAMSGRDLYGAEAQPPRTAGAVFRLSPPKAQGGPWAFKVLYSLPADGNHRHRRYPQGLYVNGPLVIQESGAIIGTTQAAGPVGTEGNIFELDPPAQKGDPWSHKVLYALENDDVGPCNPVAGLVAAPGGVLYGTGTGCAAGRGGVFSFVP